MRSLLPKTTAEITPSLQKNARFAWLPSSSRLCCRSHRPQQQVVHSGSQLISREWLGDAAAGVLAAQDLIHHLGLAGGKHEHRDATAGSVE